MQRKKYKYKRKKLRDKLNIGEKVLALVEKIKKKISAREILQPVNIASFNRDETFSIRRKQSINKIDYYWLKNLRNNKILTKRFQRKELFAVVNNFI